MRPRVVRKSALAPSGRALIGHLNHHLRSSLHALSCAHVLLRGEALSRDGALQVVAADQNARLVTAYTELLLEYLEVCGQRDTPGDTPLDAVLADAAADLAAVTGRPVPVAIDLPATPVVLSALGAARCRYLVRVQLESTIDGHPGSRVLLRVSRRVVSPPTSWLVFDAERLPAETPLFGGTLSLDAAPIGELRDLLATTLVDAIGGACRYDAGRRSSRLVVPIADDGAASSLASSRRGRLVACAGIASPHDRL